MHISVWSPIKMYIAYRLLHRFLCNSAHSAHFHWYPLKSPSRQIWLTTKRRFAPCSSSACCQTLNTYSVTAVWHLASDISHVRNLLVPRFVEVFSFKRLPFQLWFVNGFFLIVAICFMNVKSSTGLMLYKVTSKNLMSAKMGSARHLRSATSCCTFS